MNWLLGRAAGCACALACWGCAADDPNPCLVDEGYLGDPVGCVDGRAPAKLWSGTARARPEEASTSFGPSLVLDETDVYWSTRDERVLRVAKTGGRVTELVSLSNCSIRGLAVDDAWVYYTRNCADPTHLLRSTLERVPKSGGEDEVLAEQYFESREVTLGAGRVLWLHVSWADPVSFVRQLDPTSAERPGPDDSFEALAVASATYLPFVALGGEVYWFDASGRTLHVTPIGGGQSDSRLVASLESEVLELFAEGDCLFWTARDNVEHVLGYRIHKRCGDSGQEELAMAERATERMVVRGEELFGAGDNDPSSATYVARVYRWSPPDFEPTTIAAGLDFVQALARDETHLYWIDDTFGELRLYRIEF